MKNFFKSLVLSLLFFLVILLGLSETSSANFLDRKGHVVNLSQSGVFSVSSESSESKSIPHNPFSDCALKNDCSPYKYLNISISKPLLIINTERTMPSLHLYKTITSATHPKPKDIILILHSPPPKS